MSFKAEALVEKLGKLNATQQSIETTSQWCIFYRKDAKKVVEAWSSEFARSKDISKKLAMIYLANDILQNSRKKGAQFVVEFYHKLPSAIQQLAKHGDSKTQGSLIRMIQVWEERRVFGGSGVKPFMDAVNGLAKPGQRHIVLQSAQPSVERLSTASKDATEAHERSMALAEQSQALVSPDVDSATGEQLTSGIKCLQQHSTALQNEIGHCERVLSILQHLTEQQERLKQAAEQQLQGCQQLQQQHQQMLKHRQEADVSALQERLQHGGVTQSTSGSATVQGPESNGHPALGVADPARTPPDPAHEVATDVSQLLAGFGQGGSGGGTTAADLVAQLSQSGASAQMLLDAISALPQVDQRDDAHPKPPDEEEYDPELGL